MGDLIFPKLASGIDQVTEKIDQTNWGSKFTWSQVKILAKYCQIYLVPAGDFIIREGDSAGHLCIVVKGRVVVSKKDDSTRNKNIIKFGPGQAFGEMSLVDGEPRSASVKAVTETEIVVLPDEGFAELGEQVPRLAFDLLSEIARYMSQRLRRTRGELVQWIDSEE